VMRLEAVREQLDRAVSDFERFALEAGGNELKCRGLHRLELAGLEFEQCARLLECLIAAAAFGEYLRENAARERVLRCKLDGSTCGFSRRGAVPEFPVRRSEERP